MVHDEVQHGATSEGTPPVEDSPGSSGPAARAERLITDHGDVLWRFVRARSGSQDAAEEIVQETILAAMQAHAGFAGASSELTWLLGIAAHKIADHFRAARQRGEATNADASDVLGSDTDAGFTEEGMWARSPSAWGMGPTNSTENAELLAALRRCIDSLPPSQSEALWLRDLLNVPASEVCKSLGLSATNLWSRMHRARSALRQCVERTMLGGKGVERD